jgi:hypothetical protein
LPQGFLFPLGGKMGGETFDEGGRAKWTGEV